MKAIRILPLLLVCLFIAFACDTAGTGTPSSDTTSTVTDPDPSISKPSVDTPSDKTESTTLIANKQLNCKPKGKIMEDNQYWAKAEDVLVCIVADSTTMDIDFGDSYRILEAYDSKKCERIYRQTLPVNSSPDFPYYIDERTYNEGMGLVCTQGFDAVYCYDTKNKKILPALTAQYLKKRESEDAQSGMPKGLIAEGKFLFGLAEDYGSFAFDMTNKNQPKALLPSAEYLEGDNDYHALFLIPKDNGTYEGIIPAFDENEMSIQLIKLFSKPLSINPTISKQVRNNRYLVLATTDQSGRIAIDMKGQKQVDLPAEMASQSTQQILEWLRKQQ